MYYRSGYVYHPDMKISAYSQYVIGSVMTSNDNLRFENLVNLSISKTCGMSQEV